jgi:hypothetical protein
MRAVQTSATHSKALTSFRTSDTRRLSIQENARDAVVRRDSTASERRKQATSGSIERRVLGAGLEEVGSGLKIFLERLSERQLLPMLRNLPPLSLRVFLIRVLESGLRIYGGGLLYHPPIAAIDRGQNSDPWNRTSVVIDEGPKQLG